MSSDQLGVAGLHERHPAWQIRACQGDPAWSARPWAQRAEPTDGPWPVSAGTAEDLGDLLTKLDREG